MDNTYKNERVKHERGAFVKKKYVSGQCNAMLECEEQERYY